MESWLTNSKFSALIEMTKMHSSSQRSTLARMSSASKIEETELENRCSNMPLLEAGKKLPLLHLSCLSLVFLLMCCNVFSLKPTRPMCDGRLLASPLFRLLSCRGALFQGFPFRWFLQIVIFDSRRCFCMIQHVASGKILSMNVSAHATQFCLLFSALWLRCM